MAEVFSDKISVEGGYFETVCFDAKIGRTIEISAWESNKQYFDIYLVREDEIGDDYFRDEGVMVSKRSTTSFNRDYQFPEDCEAFIVIDNPKGSRGTREVHLRLTWVKFQERGGFSLRSTTFWRIVVALILVVPLLFAVNDFNTTGNLLWSGILTAIYAIVAITYKILENQIKAKIGLKDK